MTALEIIEQNGFQFSDKVEACLIIERKKLFQKIEKLEDEKKMWHKRATSYRSR